jgi:hypothetical protein
MTAELNFFHAHQLLAGHYFSSRLQHTNFIT